MRREQKIIACFFPLTEFKTTESTNQPTNQVKKSTIAITRSLRMRAFTS